MSDLPELLAELVDKYKAIADAPVEPGTHKQTASVLAEIRVLQDAILDKMLDQKSQEETQRLEEAFIAQ